MTNSNPYSNDSFIFSNEMLDGREIFAIYPELREHYIKQDVMKYYVTARTFFMQTAHHLGPKIRKGILERLNTLKSSAYISPPAIQQQMAQYKQQKYETIEKIEQILLDINIKLAETGFFKKKFVKDKYGIA